MKKIAKIINSQTVEILTFEDGVQELSEKFAVFKACKTFDAVYPAWGGFIEVNSGGVLGVLSSEGEFVVPIGCDTVRVTSKVIVTSLKGKETVYHHNGKVWEFDRPYQLIKMNYSSNCAVLQESGSLGREALFSFADNKFLVEWTKRFKHVGICFFFENEDNGGKVVCVKNDLAKCWPVEDVKHFEYATIAKVDGHYVFYGLNGAVINMGNPL